MKCSTPMDCFDPDTSLFVFEPFSTAPKTKNCVIIKMDLLQILRDVHSEQATKIAWISKARPTYITSALDSNYMSASFQDKLKKLLVSTKTLGADLAGTNVEVTYPSKMDPDVSLQILELVVRTLNKINPKSAVRILLVPIKVAKRLPNVAGKVVGVGEVNSGYAWQAPGNQKHCTVVVYRREDLYKVMIHELVHCWELDFRTYDPRIDRFLIARYNLRLTDPPLNPLNKLALYEAFTEVLASYIHAVVYSLLNKKSLAKILEKEKKHYVSVASKVSSYLATPGAQQGTHAFSYYVCKAAMFQNLDGFLKVMGRPTDQVMEFLLGALYDFELPSVGKRAFLGAPIPMTSLQW